MPNNYDIAFTHSHVVTDDGAVSFKCSRDLELWPWLALSSSHPTVIQTINYWASVETGKTRGTFDPTKWSALTFSEWRAWPGSGPVTHGIADTPPGNFDDDKPMFRLTFFDDSGEMVCRLVGTGVIFQTRDFEAWRSQAKENAGLGYAYTEFQYAPASALGVETNLERFVSPLMDNNGVAAEALITKENGLMPAHPYHSGSGDHVNANHLVDAAFQFAHLVKNKSLECTGGEMRFRHYVELGKPFSIMLIREGPTDIEMRVHQNRKKCTDIKLQF